MEMTCIVPWPKLDYSASSVLSANKSRQVYFNIHQRYRNYTSDHNVRDAVLLSVSEIRFPCRPRPLMAEDLSRLQMN
ncbi:hypothetical protein E2C01_043213 [Portunus trituberculatus]|uniref:Uncharacterized protein n=1 Tax=Portunus trituberculatus TaxID=210409 RepID=A0A5B7FYY3_PORTR|nr:hypothetical protein [Portunus trituberculatus]